MVQGRDLLVGLVVAVLATHGEAVDVRLGGVVLGVVLEQGGVRVDAGVRREGVVDDRALHGLERVHGLLRGHGLHRHGGGGLVDVADLRADGLIGQLQQAGGDEHIDGTGLIHGVVRDGDGVALLELGDVRVLLGVQGQRDDLGGPDHRQVLAGGLVVVGQVGDVLEPVHVDVAVVQRRVRLRVLGEVADLDVDAVLLLRELHQGAVRLVLGHDADAHGLGAVVALLLGLRVAGGQGERADGGQGQAGEGAAGDVRGGRHGVLLGGRCDVAGAGGHGGCGTVRGGPCGG
ncbi:Uncharacterised protein [Streptococcus pneumoniae]|nr:Uncharacterised protein [Streptococcus pneumoniae]